MRESGVDDMEYVDSLGISEELAYTPDINEAILSVIESNNYDLYIDEGKSEDEAKRLAKIMRDRGEATVNEALKLRKNPKSD